MQLVFFIVRLQEINDRTSLVRVLTKITAGYSTFSRWKKTRLMSRESAAININVIVERKLRWDGGSERPAIKPRVIKFAIWETLHMHDTCIWTSLNDHFAALSL